MPIAAPKLKSVELVDRINAQLPREIPDDLELRRIFFEATKLLDVPATHSDGQSILGMVATLKLQPDTAIQHFEAAVAESGLAADATHALISYLRLGLFTRSAPLAIHLRDSYRDDLTMQYCSLDALVRCCQLAEAQNTVVALRKLGKEMLPNWLEDYVPAFGTALERVGAKEGDLLPLLDEAAKCVIAFGKPVLGSLFSMDMSGRLAYSFGVKASDEDLVEMSFQIADALCAPEFLRFADVVTVSCLAHREDDGSKPQ